jgi:hypothetical protein
LDHVVQQVPLQPRRECCRDVDGEREAQDAGDRAEVDAGSGDDVGVLDHVGKASLPAGPQLGYGVLGRLSARQPTADQALEDDVRRPPEDPRAGHRERDRDHGEGDHGDRA